jgi:hypothetical protein
MLNVLNKDSLLSLFIEQIKDRIRFIRVSLFYVDIEYILVQKSFTNSTSGLGVRELL